MMKQSAMSTYLLFANVGKLLEFLGTNYLSDSPPLYTDSVYVFIRHIVKDPVKYPDNMSANFKSCLKGLLNKLPQSRLTWPALLEHPFVKDDSVELAAATQTTPFEVKGSGATRKADEIQTSRNQPSVADPQVQGAFRSDSFQIGVKAAKKIHRCYLLRRHQRAFIGEKAAANLVSFSWCTQRDYCLTHSSCPSICTQRNMDDQVPKKVKKENAEKTSIKRHIWKTSEDKLLLNILKDQTLNGGKEGTGYTKKAWREILYKFNDSRVDKLELQQLKNRHKYFRSCYATMSKLLAHTGFGWDDDDKMIKASNEHWEDLITRDSSIQEYHEKVWPSWIDLQEICASSTASGFNAISSKGKGAVATSKSKLIDLNEDVEVHDIDSPEKHVSPVVHPQRTEKPPKLGEKKMKCDDANGGGAPDNPKGQKRTADDAVLAMDRLAQASMSMVEMKKNIAQQNEAYSVKACMKMLYSMKDLESKKKLKAAKAFSDADQRAIFIEMDDEMRTEWILDL